MEDELEKKFGENNYNVDDSDNMNWVLTVKGQSVTIPAGKIIDTTWQKSFENDNFFMYVLDEDNKTITLRPGPGVVGENIEIKKYAVINGVKYETKFPETCSNIFTQNNNIKNILIDASINTSNVTSTSGMFYGCSKLENISLPYFVTSNVRDMRDMFNGCNSLVSLDLSTWDTSGVNFMGGMFFMSEDSKLTTIYASNSFVVTNVVDVPGNQNESGNNNKRMIFLNTKKLVGGNGTTYFHTREDGACDLWGTLGTRIDTTDTPGLFTEK